MLQALDVWKKRGNMQVLRGLSAEVRPGEIVGIVGPNASGKSTFLQIAAGVLLPDSGKVLLSGRDIHSDYRAKSLVTTVFQETMFEATMTPQDALLFHARVL